MLLDASGPLVVLDLEFTAWRGSRERNWSRRGEHREIIHIGAVRLGPGPAFEETDILDILVRPARNPNLSDYIVDLTGITQEELDEDGMPYAEAQEMLDEFVTEDVAMVLANGDDRDVLRENADLNQVKWFSRDDSMTNIRDWLANGLEREPGSFESAELPALLGAESPGPAHDALADARAIALAMRLLYPRGFSRAGEEAD